MEFGELWRWLDRVRRWQWVSALVAALADMMWVLLPSDCVVCGGRDAVLCTACRNDFHRATLKPFRAEEAAEALPLDLETNEVLPVWAAGLYKDGVSSTLLAFKNHQRFTLKTELGRALARSLARALEEIQGAIGEVLIVPIPASAASMRKRGYWPVGELLKVALKSVRAGPSVGLAPILKVAGATGSSHRGASARDRRSQRGRMSVVAGLEPARGEHVILVDDVLTTGATLAKAHAVLSESGYCVIGAVVLAATQNPR